MDGLDLEDNEMFSVLAVLGEDGVLDIVLGGPPCGTWSPARFLMGGPPPVRRRNGAEWGLKGLKGAALQRVRSANALMLNFMFLCEVVSRLGGCYLLEHPEDRGRDPFPSVWCTQAMLELERRVGGIRRLLHQCALGARYLKPTCMSTNLLFALGPALRCPGCTSHLPACGRLARGGFASTAAAQYPSTMCWLLARWCLLQLVHWRDEGASGAKASQRPARSAWSYAGLDSRQPGLCLMNEIAPAGRRVILDGQIVSAYIHVDDGIIMSDGSPGVPKCDFWAGQCVSALRRRGFEISGYDRSGSPQKVLGYRPVSRPAALRLTPDREALLASSLDYLASVETVDLVMLRAVLGIWIWGALLRRELLSIPHAVFRYLDVATSRRAFLWASVRRELRAMSAAIPFMEASLGRPISRVLLASDAQGPGEGDHGGFGVVATTLSQDEAESCFRSGTTPRHTVCTLDGNIRALRFPDRALARQVPFSSLPPGVLDKPLDDWVPLVYGRWRWADHITLGEGRSAVHGVELVARCGGARGFTVMSLQDNLAFSGAASKGRSPAIALNFILRRLTSLSLTSNLQFLFPWVQTKCMPADGLSRIQVA